jgi:putative transposase/transposase-like zinc-binding protein
LSCKNRGVCPSCTSRRMSDTAAHLVDRVLPVAPYRQWVLTFPHPLRFRLARKPALQTAVLAIFLAAVFAWQRRAARKAGVRGRCGAITFVQRFGSLLNLNLHFHSIVPDGVLVPAGEGSWSVHPTFVPNDAELLAILGRVIRRVTRLVADPADGDEEPDVLAKLQAEALKLPLASDADHEVATPRHCVHAGGFSLHAGRHVAAADRRALEALCRYAARPPFAQSRLSRSPTGQVVYHLKRPLRDGRRQLVLAPLDFLRRLAALVPPPRSHLVRYSGVFAPGSSCRQDIIPAAPTDTEPSGLPSDPKAVRPRRLPWAQLLKRVLNIDVLACSCGNRREIIAFVTDPAVINKILRHLHLPTAPPPLLPARASPQADLELELHP